MASSRRRNTPRRTRRGPTRRGRNRRAIFSKLQHVADNAPLRCNMPKDPPALNSSNSTANILAIRVIAGTAATWTDPALGEMAQLVLEVKPATNGKITAYSFTPALLHAGICGRFGFDKAVNAEYALIKVQYWGPTATQLNGKEIRPTLSVDTQTISGGITINDVGTQFNRATLGVSLPVMYWYDRASPNKLFTLAPDLSLSWSAGQELGILYLTVSRKAFKSL